MGHEARLSKFCGGPIRDAIGALEELDCGVIGRGKLQLLKISAFNGDHTARFLYRGVRNIVHLGHWHSSTQGQTRVLQNQPGGGYLEVHCHHH